MPCPFCNIDNWENVGNVLGMDPTVVQCATVLGARNADGGRSCHDLPPVKECI